MSSFKVIRDLVIAKSNIESILDDYFKDEFDSYVYPCILIYVYNSEKPIHQIDIEKEIKIKRSTLSDFLNYLEKNEYIIRTVNENDSRRKEVTLTSKAETRILEYEEKFEKLDDYLKSKLTKTDVERFEKILNEINCRCEEVKNEQGIRK